MAARLGKMRSRGPAVRYKHSTVTSKVVHLCVCALHQTHCSAGCGALQDTYLMRRLWLCNCRLLWDLLWEMYFRGAKQPLLQQNQGVWVRQGHAVILKLIWGGCSSCCHTFYTHSACLCFYLSWKQPVMLFLFLVVLSPKASFIEVSCLHQKSSNNLWSYLTAKVAGAVFSFKTFFIINQTLSESLKKQIKFLFLS